MYVHSREQRQTHHKTREKEAGPSPAKNHVAGDFQEKVSDEEDRDGKRVIRGAELQSVRHAGLLRISYAVKFLA